MRPNRTLLLAILLSGLATRPALAQEPSALAVLSAAEEAMVDVIAKAEKSVVAIARVRKQRPGEVLGYEFQTDPFGNPVGPAPGPDPTDPSFIPNEYGTGVVIDRRGLILTAYHVLGEDSDYYVRTHDRRVYTARVRAADPRSDLAVLAIDADNLSPVTLGDGGSLRKGQIVLALGNPYAIARDGQASASWGIVSNLARKSPPLDAFSESAGTTIHEYGTLIQTDIRLALGTSGGPLLNLRGEMVGLTVSLAATAGMEMKAGYAIPVDDTFRRALERLRQGREVEYGFLGIQPTNLTRRELLDGKQGVRVSHVVPGTPADRFGLRQEDLVVSVNGRPIRESDDLMREVGRLPVESTARIGVERDDRPRAIRVALAKYPVRGRKIVTAPEPQWRGLRVDYSTTAAAYAAPAQGLAADMFADGVVASDVEEGSPAWKAGLRPGMIISHVDGTPVLTPAEFHRAVSRSDGSVPLRMAAPEPGEPSTRVVSP